MKANPGLATAKAKGKLGSQRAGERADRASEGWTERAALEIYRFARKYEGPFTIELVRMGYGDQPKDGRAWGHATRLAGRNGWIRFVGYQPTISSHYSPKCLWTKA